MKTHKFFLAFVATFIAFGSAYSQNNDILTGPVGIGTSYPNADLHIHNDEWHEIPALPSNGNRDGITPQGYYYTTFQMTNTNTGLNSNDGFLMKLSDTEIIMKLQENSLMKILAKNNQGITIDSVGRIGIGTTPVNNRRLIVDGNVAFTGTANFGGNITTEHNLSAININASGTMTIDGAASIGTGFYCSWGGHVKTKELVVTLEGWSDYVFDSDYKLMPLGELEHYVSENKHLPNIPSATEVEKEGVNVGEMNALLLEKIEELTLYIIDLQKQIDELKQSK